MYGTKYRYWIYSTEIRVRKRERMYHSSKSVAGRICLDKANEELRKKEELIIEDPISLWKLVQIGNSLDHSAILLPNVVSRQPK